MSATLEYARAWHGTWLRLLPLPAGVHPACWSGPETSLLPSAIAKGPRALGQHYAISPRNRRYSGFSLSFSAFQTIQTMLWTRAAALAHEADFTVIVTGLSTGIRDGLFRT